ncbi:hypothetical protein QRB41_14980 [Mycobacterium avium subsp. hominissuis]|uniref:Uncharacterized protein n=1 Tax=Mycobacterium intracellulare subsp. chimaera TaxID=222805 RepID=A0ABT7P3D6_MYCIT|nr:MULTISPECIES: hypothetical protein [Mycobacterium avium complex (MAC)]MDM3927802.1 hypothetical protein [Mycobacterium intracellulare subsp. chimaera]MDO2384671.1 hypothetical protein [Mycobacterium avium subsp. hominissuis]
MDTAQALARHKAQVNAKYADAQSITLAGLRAERVARHRQDRWLLITPDGDIDGVLSREVCKSAIEAFDKFFPRKKERHAAAAEGWHIEVDDEHGTRYSAWAASNAGTNAGAPDEALRKPAPTQNGSL